MVFPLLFLFYLPFDLVLASISKKVLGKDLRNFENACVGEGNSRINHCSK
jgi:hypothetical protein